MTRRTVAQIRAEFAIEEERLESLAKADELEIRRLQERVQRFRSAPFHVTAEELGDVCDAFRLQRSLAVCWSVNPGHQHALVVKSEDPA